MACAALTAVSGGVGVISLWQIENDARQTGQQISELIDQQANQSRRFAALRSLVSSITAAENATSLTAAADELQKLRSAAGSSDRQIGEVLSAIDQLLKQRGQELLAAANLALSAKRAEEVVADLMRAGETAAAASQAGAARKLKETVTGIETGAKTNQQALASDLDRLSNETGKAINTIKAALVLRNRGQELNIQVKDSLLVSDPAAAEYSRSKIATLLGNAEEEVASLPDVDGKDKLAKAFPSLRKLVTQMIDLRITRLSPKHKVTQAKPGDLGRIVQTIRETLDQIEAATLGIADTLQFDSTVSMDDTLKEIKGRTTRNSAESSQRVALLAGSTNQGISTIQAANDVRMHCQALKTLAQEAVQAKDPAIVAKARNCLPGLIGDVKADVARAAGEAGHRVPRILNRFINALTKCSMRGCASCRPSGNSTRPRTRWPAG